MWKPRIMIVDDEVMPRELFEMYIKNSGKFELAGSVSLAEYAYAYSLTQKIDLIIMDIVMKNGSSGLAAAARIKENNPEIKIVLVTSMPEASWLQKAREIGVESFWYKETNAASILDVIDKTLSGESVYPDAAPSMKLGLCEVSAFTDKEMQIIRLLTTGAPNATIAEKMGMSEGTIKQYLNRILAKTGCDNRTELAVKARVSGVAIVLDV